MAVAARVVTTERHVGARVNGRRQGLPDQTWASFEMVKSMKRLGAAMSVFSSFSLVSAGRNTR